MDMIVKSDEVTMYVIDMRVELGLLCTWNIFVSASRKL